MHYILSLVLLITTLYGDELFNSNLLVQHKIDPTILNSVISSTRQNIAYRMNVEHLILSKGESKDLDYLVVVDPFPSYGVELYLQVPKKELNKVDKNRLEKSIDMLMGVQLNLQHGTLYELNSLKVESENEHTTVISFDFKKEALPRELKHFRDMKGYIYIVDDLLEKIIVKNSFRFKLRGIEVDSFKKCVYFKPVKKSGYLVSKETLLIQGMYENQKYRESIDGVVSEYWNVNKKEITFESGSTSKQIDIESEKYEKISIELDRFFPILGKEARKAGYDLPKPFGVTLINMFQDTTMHMTSFKIDGSNISFNSVLDGDSIYKNITYSPLVRADIWVLPFVSFSVILGGTDTTTNVTLASESGLSVHSPFPIPGGTDHEIIKPGASLSLDPFTTNAFLYGVGATVAGGFDNYFTTIDFQYVVAYTPEADVSVDMMIITPLVGYTLSDYATRFFIGAQYQRLAQSLTFKIPTDKGDVSGVIGLESEEWAGVVGTDYSFTRNWSANLLYSQGVDRKNMVLGISYRF